MLLLGLVLAACMRRKWPLEKTVGTAGLLVFITGAIVESDVIIKYSFVYTDTPILSQNDNKKVGTLKKGSRFGANVTIMPGITIGENSEIGACSLVRNHVQDNEIWYGLPAKFYKKI